MHTCPRTFRIGNKLVHLIQNRRNYDPVSILHTADIHLPGSFEEPARNDIKPSANPFCALEAVIKTANTHRVDLVLISGDLFDTYHPTPEAICRAIEIMDQLISPVVIIPGNHDALGDSETYHMPQWGDRNLCPYIIKRPDGEVLEVPNIPVLVWGRAMVEHSPDFQPLEGIPGRDGGAWHVAMAHGFYYTQNKPGDRSSPIYDRDIRDSGWDYIALGHNHYYGDVSQGSVRAAYSGSPVGLGNQDTKAVLVSLDGRRADPVLLERIDIFE
jgi:DNA repair exonuclease SbcCD nuclease subunit